MKRKIPKLVSLVSNFQTMSETATPTQLEHYFDSFRKDIIGINQTFESPFGKQKLFTPIGQPVDVCIDLLRKTDE